MPALPTHELAEFHERLHALAVESNGVIHTAHSLTQLFSARDPTTGQNVGGIPTEAIDPKLRPGSLLVCRYGYEGGAVCRVLSDCSLQPLFGTLEPIYQEKDAPDQTPSD